MKTNLTILAIGFLLSFCTPKTEVAPTDDRDKFIGSYKGTATLTASSNTETNSTDFEITKDGSNLNLGGLKGSAKGNTITTNQISTSQKINGTLATIIIDSGVLTLNGNSLSGTLPMTVIANNQSIKGTYKVEAAKQ